MKVEKAPIEGLLVFTPDVFGDDRGFFMESFSAARYREAGIALDFVQDNLSKSTRGVLRGLHFQKPPYEQGKLVTVVQGAVYDVAVDIRKDSPTFGQYFGLQLDSTEKKQLWIPPGFAHGFVTLKDDTIFSYKCTSYYAPNDEGGILWNDPDIAIEWPLPKSEILLSEKDKQSPSFKDIDSPF